jgi:hypothetical protein
MTEQWKDVPGYKGDYKISNMGRVKSFRQSRKGKILKERYDARGYVQYILCYNTARTSYKGHHLVWDNFGEGERNGRIINVDHIDEVKDNNNINNLQLLTNRENLAKGFLKNKNKSSKYTGVYKPKKSTLFQAYITINKKHIYLGSFDYEYDAYMAYKKEADGLN